MKPIMVWMKYLKRSGGVWKKQYLKTHWITSGKTAWIFSMSGILIKLNGQKTIPSARWHWYSAGTLACLQHGQIPVKRGGS